MNEKKDIFAEIAHAGLAGRPWLMTKNEPVSHQANKCYLTDKFTGKYDVPARANDHQGLKQELKELRAKMAQFLENHAPALRPFTKREEIKEFLLDGKEIVKIPHYGGPIGYALKTYEADFTVEKIPGKAYYACFKGADYIAVVYVNGRFVGRHEGFFAPFDFEITEAVVSGTNKLKIELYNDYPFDGYAHGNRDGEKLYAATGLGWDDPQKGWHHCPPGMGLYGKVFIEERNIWNLTDLCVRPLDSEKAELWVEVNCAEYPAIPNVKLIYSIYGQNFAETVAENVGVVPTTHRRFGFGAVITEEETRDHLNEEIPMRLGHGMNLIKIPVEIPNARIWSLENPWLYQLQVTLEVEGVQMDAASCQFGMRTFTQDLEDTRKGMFYLNGNKIRLRGANTMGFEQQDVLREDYDQLIDDILLAKLCNMNFLRLTQRPVQDEVYEYCDKLGLMTQTDLPLFGVIRRSKAAECVRQSEEMIKMVRKHPCNVMISYINEPNASCRNAPCRFLPQPEMQRVFEMCDHAVLLMAPDQVIKHVDGDYDPPRTNMPDNHCYAMWYAGHGLDLGRLHKGFWQDTLPNWYYGCGEFGAEGLDSREVIEGMYPKEWLQEPFDPKNIVRCQVPGSGKMFYDAQEGMDAWIEETQRHQAFATRWMTEAFRRDDRMVSFAIHLFIDAWPSGWMKTIMDCKRIPKKAYFAYRDALQPKLLSLRTDRLTYTSGDEVAIECFLCNDTNEENENYQVVYELYRGGKKVLEGKMPAQLKNCSAGYTSEACFTAPDVEDREMFTLRAVLLNENGVPVSENVQNVEIFADVELPETDENTVLYLDLNKVRGPVEIAGETVVVKGQDCLGVHFVSRDTGHKAVSEFRSQDFAYWYDASEDMITTIARSTFTAEGFTPILLCANRGETGGRKMYPCCAEKIYDGKRYIISTIEMRTENPVAKRFLRNLLKG